MNAIKSEPFFIPVITTAVPRDPITLHALLHQCYLQLDTSLNNGTPTKTKTSSSNIFLLDEDNTKSRPIDLHYSQGGNAYFKRRITRGSSSFSNPNYRGQLYTTPKQHVATSPHPNRYQHPVTFSPKRNQNGPDGKPFLCSFYNSWCHLYRNCSDRPDASVHFSAQDGPHEEHQYTAETPQNVVPNLFDRSVNDYSFSETHDHKISQSDCDVEKNGQEIVFLTLVYHASMKFAKPKHEHPQLEPRTSPPRLRG